MNPTFADHSSHFGLLREAALRAADPAAAVRRALSAEDLTCRGRIFVVGAGKAGVAMAHAAEDILGDRIAAGVVGVPVLPVGIGHRVQFILGGHPLPTEGSVAAGNAISNLLKNATGEDLVLVLLSGGGSALMELPAPGISLGDLQAVNALFLKSGAAIHEINRLRTPLSLLKGGGLARLADPARILALILSDVVGNDLETIASGPTVYTYSPPAEIAGILEKYRLRDSLPPAVLACFDRIMTRPFETLPPDTLVENRIIASNRLAGEAAFAVAKGLGFRTAYIADDWQGEARESGKKFAELLIRERGFGPACCIAGGETTVTIRGTGKGGRNQEAALAAAIVLDGEPDIALATLATDGVDGPTDSAGAVVTGRTAERARRLGMDPAQYLSRNDSYSFFSPLGDLIRTGPTGTNVNDLWIGLAY